LKAAERRVT